MKASKIVKRAWRQTRIPYESLKAFTRRVLTYEQKTWGSTANHSVFAEWLKNKGNTWALMD